MNEMMETKAAMAYLEVGRTRLYKYITDGKLTVYRRKDNLKLSYFSKEEMDRIKNEVPEFVKATEINEDETEKYPTWTEEELTEVLTRLENKHTRSNEEARAIFADFRETLRNKYSDGKVRASA